MSGKEPLELRRGAVTLRGELARPVDARGLVVLVHGLGEHLGRYEEVTQHLLAAGWAVGRIDLRGHGRSDGERGDAESVDQLVADVHAAFLAFAERVSPGPRFLYGHSMGGMLALALALAPPAGLSGVVASSPGLLPAVPPPRWKIWAGRLALRVRPRHRLHNGLPPAGMSRRPEVVAAYEADPLVHGYISARLGLSLLATGPALVRRAAETAVPLLVLQGDADRITNYAAARAFAQGAGARAIFVSFPGLYHELHNEPERAQVLGRVTRWLDEVAGGGPATGAGSAE